jgi:hypothetical protein
VTSMAARPAPDVVLLKRNLSRTSRALGSGRDDGVGVLVLDDRDGVQTEVDVFKVFEYKF